MHIAQSCMQPSVFYDGMIRLKRVEQAIADISPKMEVQKDKRWKESSIQ